MTAVFLKHAPHFHGETTPRDIYQIILSRGTKGFSFSFGQSLKDTAHNRNAEHRLKPGAYDVLSCLTKSEPEDSLDNFADAFGYTKPSEALRVYNALREEWREVCDLWTPEERELLAEIN